MHKILCSLERNWGGGRRLIMSSEMTQQHRPSTKKSGQTRTLNSITHHPPPPPVQTKLTNSPRCTRGRDVSDWGRTCHRLEGIGQRRASALRTGRTPLDSSAAMPTRTGWTGASRRFRDCPRLRSGRREKRGEELVSWFGFVLLLHTREDSSLEPAYLQLGRDQSQPRCCGPGKA